jgi:hypothetical protein
LFICRASKESRFGPARLYVTVRGLEVPEAIPQESYGYLESILTHAQSIRLTHIEMSRLFRLTCDVQVDGKDLSQQLVSKGLAKRKEGPILSVSSPLKTHPARETNNPIPIQSNSVRLPGRGIRITDWKSLLDQPVDLSVIQSDTPFRQALEMIRTSIEPPLPMMINWNDIQGNAFIGPDHPVGIDGLRNFPIGQVLELLLNAVDGGKGQLAFATRGQILVIASKRSLGDSLNMRVYNVSELTSPRSTGYGMNQMGGQMGSGYGMAGSMGGQMGTPPGTGSGIR